MKHEKRSKSIRVCIVILAILLAMSVAALAGLLLYDRLRPQEAPAVSPDNVIAPGQMSAASALRGTTLAYGFVPVAQPARVYAGTVLVDQAAGETVTLKLYRDHAEASAPFQAGNLFPGDAVTKRYALEVSYRGSVTVRFHADIRSGYEKLAEVLKCRVAIEDGATLYDGLMRDMPQSVSYTLPASTDGTTATVSYVLTAYLETSVGNEYMAKELYADFRWWVDEERSDTPTGPTDPSNPDQPTDPSNPDQPTDPSNPTQPTDPSNPEQPTDPSNPNQPTDPSNPTQPTDPSNPTQPVEPGKPGESVEPIEPVEPVEPGELISPQAGDPMHLFCIWFWIAMASILLNIILLVTRRRKSRKEQEAAVK